MTSLQIRHWLLENVKVLNIAGGDFVKHLFQRFVHNVAHNLKQNDLEDVRSTVKVYIDKLHLLSVTIQITWSF